MKSRKIGDPVSVLGRVVFDRKNKKFGRLICLRPIGGEIVAIDLTSIRKKAEIPKKIKHCEFKAIGTYVGNIHDPTGKTSAEIKLIKSSTIILETSYF
ncbi:MAG: hypothetical protein PHE24_03240 [Patescibacteria group bacterium]|nr:hypothetical protein [Patescibacteria group bacterium]